MTELVTGPDFRGFVRGYQHTAFRLEVRDRYNEPGEAEPLQRFLAGEPIGDWYEDWEELQRRWAAEGKRMTRVRVVSRAAHRLHSLRTAPGRAQRRGGRGHPLPAARPGEGSGLARL